METKIFALFCEQSLKRFRLIQGISSYQQVYYYNAFHSFTTFLVQQVLDINFFDIKRK